MIKAVFFDFNGTLYLDHDINEIAWKKTINDLSNNKIDFYPFYNQYKSVMNYIVIQDAYKLINKPYTEKEIKYWIDYKENIYRNYGVENNRTRLINGAEILLDYLKENNIPRILCTSSINDNVNYYFKYFNLEKWFDRNQVVYDTGEYVNKIEMYKKCANILNVNPKEVLVFEDSPKSIKEAIDSGCNKIIAIKRKDTPNYKEIIQTINDYTEFNFALLEK